MPKITKDDLIEKLNYIGLDLNNVPEFLKDFKALEFRPSAQYDEKKYKVYRYLPIDHIQILLSISDRTMSLKERYKLATPIYPYLVPEKEEDIEKHALFLNMLNEVTVEDIEKIEQEQKQLESKIPFTIKYPDNYMWQIYYSEYADTYFMLVPVKDAEYASFFYLLKKQLEEYRKKRTTKIFVPICYQDYRGELLKKTEIVDIENFLWLFTNDWPQIYEVYDKKEELNLHIIGTTNVYDGIKSMYHIKLTDSQKAQDFYRLVKALFILQTELSSEYTFQVKVNIYGSLDFYYDDKKLTYEMLPEFLKQECQEKKNTILKIIKENREYTNRLTRLKTVSALKEQEYLSKEKQIATYLDCKKTFLGKVKYFFKYSSRKKQQEIEKMALTREKQQEKTELEEDWQMEEKEMYTIEDLVVLCHQLEKRKKENKDLEMDSKALQDKIDRMDKKIDNADIYLKEIDNHKKSIFEFWKFANKDEKQTLTEGERQEELSEPILEKIFLYPQDREELAVKMDERQRKRLTKEECDNLFIAIQPNMIAILNLLKKEKLSSIEQKQIKENLEQLEQELEQEKVIDIRDIDIFGSILQEGSKINILGGKKHREVEKNKYHLLEINRNIRIQDYENLLRNILESVKQAIKKIKSPYAMPVYKATLEGEQIKANDIEVFDINPENVLKGKELEKDINLYKINVKEEMPILFTTNSIFYDNQNQTLPMGMDVREQAIIDLDNFELQEVRQKEFRINHLVSNGIYNQKVYVFEYDLKKK